MSYKKLIFSNSSEASAFQKYYSLTEVINQQVNKSGICKTAPFYAGPAKHQFQHMGQSEQRAEEVFMAKLVNRLPLI